MFRINVISLYVFSVYTNLLSCTSYTILSRGATLTSLSAAFNFLGGVRLRRVNIWGKLFKLLKIFLQKKNIIVKFLWFNTICNHHSLINTFPIFYQIFIPFTNIIIYLCWWRPKPLRDTKKKTSAYYDGKISDIIQHCGPNHIFN